MSEDELSYLTEHIDLFQCPKCGEGLGVAGAKIRCLGCDETFPVIDGIPMLFWPSEFGETQDDVTDIVKAFYEETPFPNYDEFDSVASLARKAREGVFARLLDQQVPPGARILECGCGTGQLSNFLSIANRTVFATDLCVNSLRLGQDFARKHHLTRVHFAQMNLFRPVFKPETFHLVVSNGVLHHTSDPFRAFQSIGALVKPGGFILIGLYHKYGRLITDARRLLFKLSGDRYTSLDPNLRRRDSSREKRRAWFADQYKHPHESKHTIGETLAWLRATGFRFVRSIPRSKPFQPLSETEDLFRAEEPGNALERLLVELPMVFKGSREGGFFIVIAQKS
jgi:SAM-dependent methyltransferase